MIMDELITARSEAHVTRAKSLGSTELNEMLEADRAAYEAGLKGAYNAADMNRVGEATEWLAQYGTEMSRAVKQYLADRTIAMQKLLDPNIDESLADRQMPRWNGTEIPQGEALQAYLDGVEVVVHDMGGEWLLPQTMSGLSTTGANQIEQAILDQKNAIDKTQARIIRYADLIAQDWWTYSGESYAGEMEAYE